MIISKKILIESLTATDIGEIEKIARREAKNIVDNKMAKKIEDTIKKEIKGNKDLEDRITDITANVMTQLFKSLWTRKSYWMTGIRSKSY